jgi:hypothetical protein
MWDLNDGRPPASPITFWACLIGVLGVMALIGIVINHCLQ